MVYYIFLSKVSHAFCIILHMKLFTKETLTHTSLYQLEVAHRDRGRRGGGQEGKNFFFPQMGFTSQAIFQERNSQVGATGREEGQHAVSAPVEDTGEFPPLTPKLKVSLAQSWADTTQGHAGS